MVRTPFLRYTSHPSSLLLHCAGKYVGNRPIRLKKAENTLRPVEIGHNKAKQLEKERKSKRHRPY